MVKRSRYFPAALTCFGLALLPISADAQFNARGRGRKPPAAHSSQNTQPPSSPATRKTPPPKSSGQREENRNSVLIERYFRLILQQPGEEVPLVRLAELVRKRDGNLNQLFSLLEEKSEKGVEKYSVLVAWAGLLEQEMRTTEGIEKAKSASRINEKRKEAWIMLGRLQRKMGQRGAARSSLEKARPLVSGLERTEVTRSLRDLSLDLGEHELAQSYHDQLVRQAPGNLFLRGELGRELLKRGQSARAVAAQSRVVKRSRSSRALSLALRDLGEAELAEGKYQDAIESLTRASKLSVATPGQRIAIDELLAGAHRKNGSFTEFLRRLESSARSASRLGLLGRLYEEEGQTEEATRAYLRALQAEPKNVDLQLRLVQLFELTGDLKSASVQYEKLVKSSPQDIQLSLRYMEMLLAQGFRDRAVQEWDRIDRNTRNDPEAGLLLIDFAERLDESKRADGVLARLGQARGGDARFLVELGSRFFRGGKEKEARRTWDKIPQVHRDPTRAQILLGEVLIDHDSVKDGLLALRQAVKLSPQSIQAHRSLALGLERAAAQGASRNATKTKNEALSVWLKLLQLPQDPSSRSTVQMARRHTVRLWKSLGVLQEKLDDLDRRLGASTPDLDAGKLLVEGLLKERKLGQATTTLRRILQQEPGDRDSLLLLESVHARAKENKQVIAVLEQLIQVDPARAREYYKRMARAASQDGDGKSALKYAELAVARSPDDPQAQAGLADLQRAQGRLQQAEISYRKALKADDRLYPVALSLAEVLVARDQGDEALALLLHIVRTAPDVQLVSQASRRALALSVPTNQVRKLEDALRPVAISRSNRPIYRTLLLEALSAQMHPLIQRASFGSSSEKIRAQEELARLSERSTQPLLSALAGDNVHEQKLAIRLLSHGTTKNSGNALLAFAEGSSGEELRLLAILAAGSIPRAALFQRMKKFVISEEVVRRGRVAQAAAWATSRIEHPDVIPVLAQCIKAGGLQLKTISALGLAQNPTRARAKKQEINQLLVELLQSPSAGPAARAAAVLTLSYQPVHAASLSKITPRMNAILLATEDHSPLVAQAALIGLSVAFRKASLQNSTRDETLRRLTSAFFSPQAEVRFAAETAALSLLKNAPPDSGRLLPRELSPQDIDATALVQRVLDQTPLPADKERYRALELLHSFLKEAALLSIRTSEQKARATLAQLTSPDGAPVLGRLVVSEDREQASGAQAVQFAEEIRTTLLTEIIRLATSANPDLNRRAIQLLQPEDGSEAARILADSLTHPDSGVMQAALFSMTRAPSEEGIEMIAQAIGATTTWSRRRRLILTLAKMATRNEQLRDHVTNALQEFREDPNQLVRALVKKNLQGTAEATSD